jgi:hypothetical protein
LQPALISLEMEPQIASILAESPTPQRQREVLSIMVGRLEPLLKRHGLIQPFSCETGLRLERRYGMCRFDADGSIRIHVRCTRDGDRQRWRQPSAIMATLVHEVSHLRHRGHSKNFWRLCRGLLDEAAARGLYCGALDDASERPQGRDRLAGSAADAVVSAARVRRRERTQAASQLVTAWPLGAWARLPNRGGGRASHTLVQVVMKRRTRLVVQTRGGRRYLVSASLLEPPSAGG